MYYRPTCGLFLRDSNNCPTEALSRSLKELWSIYFMTYFSFVIVIHWICYFCFIFAKLTWHWQIAIKASIFYIFRTSHQAIFQLPAHTIINQEQFSCLKKVIIVRWSDLKWTDIYNQTCVTPCQTPMDVCLMYRCRIYLTQTVGKCWK